MKHIIILLVCMISFSFIIFAQSGTLDSSFGNNGKVFSETFTAACSAIAIQQDGKIVVAGGGGYDTSGGFFLARYNSDGTLDNSFGDEGRVITTVAQKAGNIIEYITILPTSKILAAGWFGTYSLIDIALLQYNSNGSLDSSFGVGGIVKTDIARFDYVYDMAVQSDGKIIVAGDRIKSEFNDNATSFTVRYLPNGSLDNSFGEEGIVLTKYTSNVDITTVALQPDGKVILGGIYDGSHLEFMLVRYLSNGSLDESFGVNGIARLLFANNLGDYAELFDLTIQSNGKIVAAGNNGRLEEHMVVARFNSDGNIDEEFGERHGYTSSFFEEGISIASAVLIQDDGRILLSGSYYDEAGYFTLLRLKENGRLDSSFGENGITLTSFENAGTITCDAAAIQKEGNIVLAGTSLTLTPPDYYHFILATYNNEIKTSQPEFAKIKKWQDHYGFTWNDWPGNKTNYYSVGRSTNASTFSEIAQVLDIPGQKKYQFEDPAPPAGIVYYQLTAIRSDGKTVSSNIISAGTAVSAIKLFPNPAKNSLRIEGLSVTDKTKLTIVDVSGNIKVAATATGSSHTINIAQLKPGNYMLRIETNGNVVTRMFVKE